MEGVLFVVDLRHMTIGDTIVGCWTVSFTKKNDYRRVFGDIYYWPQWLSQLRWTWKVMASIDVLDANNELDAPLHEWYLVTHHVDLGEEPSS